MFKTIEQCRLELVAHSVMADMEAYSPDETRSEQQLDFFPCSAARVSFGNEDKTGKDRTADKKLMKYLADHEHMTPFEHQSATFLVEVPLFIRSQIMRHRTFAYNEISRRYTDENLEFWWPGPFRKQASSNRQASSEEVVSDSTVKGRDESNNTVPVPLAVLYQAGTDNALELYNELVRSGVCREQARAVLPQSLLTKFYMTGNLRNWAHFVRLRKDSHAQKEVQVVANKIDEQLKALWPTAWGVLTDERRIQVYVEQSM